MAPKSARKKSRLENTEMAVVATFRDWGLDEEVQSALIREKFISKQALLLMSEEDIDALALTRGDRAMLRAAVDKLQLDNGGGPLSGGRGATADNGCSRRAPQSLQDSLYVGDSPQHGGLAELLRDSLHVSGGGTCSATLKGGPPLRIVDFLSSRMVAEEEVALGGGVTIKVNSRLKLDKVSPAHWIVANSRIMAALMDKPAPGFTPQAYLKYSAMVGELAARYTWQSVLLFDDEYRQRQAADGFQWGTDAPHLSTVVLRDRTAQSAMPPGLPARRTGGGGTAGPRPHRPIGPSGREVCLQFNRGYCTYGARCQLDHVCTTCGKEHPAREHPDTPAAATSGRHA